MNVELSRPLSRVDRICTIPYSTLTALRAKKLNGNGPRLSMAAMLAAIASYGGRAAQHIECGDTKGVLKDRSDSGAN
jgi:hypothetical protein